MPVYEWRGRLKSGVIVKGEIVAVSKEEVEERLRREEIEILDIVQKKEKKIFRIGRKKIDLRDLALFSRQLSAMLEAGMPIADALNVLRNQFKKVMLKKICSDLVESISAGASLAEAIREHEKIFGSLYVNMIEAGERTGTLPSVLNRLSSYYEWLADLREKVKTSMIYPFIVAGVGVIAITFFIAFVIPLFGRLYSYFNLELPTLTRIVLNVAHFVRVNILYILILFLFLAILFVIFRQTKTGRKVIDWIILKLPIIGPLQKKIIISRFSRTFGSSVGAGVDLMTSLEISSKVVNNYIVERDVIGIQRAVAQGESISGAMKRYKFFPPMVVQMVAIGEQAGNLEEMLNRVADFYDKEVSYGVERFTKNLEVILILFIAGVIGFMIVSMYLPIFKLIGYISEAMKGGI
ncbi:hypothetical protein DRN73_05460 [Candidatus Pacearchaeota archaeon]|nr:MAG: hypothetical protein DRN73_05460 [Candidatus Pacearchaeota archaeon]